MARTVIRLNFPSEEHSRIVLRALKPETETAPTRRSKIRVRRDGKELILSLEAKDTSALRAAVNSYLRFVYLAKTTLDVAEALR